MDGLIGIGVYTPAEAGRLIQIPAPKISRWLQGHCVNNREYRPLWKSQIQLPDGRLYLGFRDLMEARIAGKFIAFGISPQRVRAAIQLAQQVIGDERPLSTDRFRTDGRDIFLRVVETDEEGRERERLLNLFRQQYEFRQIIEPLLKNLDFDDQGTPYQWWPLGKHGKIVVDPQRAFGQPLDAATSVPTVALAAAAANQGAARAARFFDVPPASVRRAVAFERMMETRAAA
jgi:uncharacterized protein (DUF433 family)